MMHYLHHSTLGRIIGTPQLHPLCFRWREGGRADTLMTASAAVRPGGRVSVLGLFTESPQLSPLSLLMKEIDLCWSNCYHRAAGQPADFRVAADIVDREREQLASLITHRYGLDEIDQAFATASDKRAGALKVAVTLA